MTNIIAVPALLSALAVLSWCLTKVKLPTWLEAVQRFANWSAGKDELSVLSNRLEALRVPISAELFVAFRATLTYLPIFLGFVLIIGGNTRGLILMVAALFMRRATPLILSLLEKRRKEALLRDFPIMLDQIKIYAKAAGYYQALKIVAKSLKGELGRELALLSAEMELLGTIKAINNFADRSGIPEFKDFARIMTVERTTGADISDTLLNYSNMVRQKQVSHIKRKIKLQPILMSFLPGVLIILLMMMFIVPLVANIVEQINAI